VSVLILAEALDPCADLMVRALVERGAVVHRLDTAWFPGQIELEARLRDGRWVGSLRSPHHATRLEDIESVWYRSPAAFALPNELSAAERQHIRIEGKYGLGGVLLSLPVRWINRPDLSATACYKPLQMVAAAHAGLTIADTVIANTAGAVRRFVTEQAAAADGQVVTKMLASASITEPGGRRVAFTRAVGPGQLTDLTGIESTAHLVQSRVPKAFDARVVVIGTDLFGFAIHADSPAARLDFRRDYAALRYDRIELPADVAAGITALMTRLGLLYAAIDFVIDTSGRWVFIGDVNPGGQYGWLEAATDAPLTATLADLLIHQEEAAS
jgi:hypothetical protein